MAAFTEARRDLAAVLVPVGLVGAADGFCQRMGQANTSLLQRHNTYTWSILKYTSYTAKSFHLHYFLLSWGRLVLRHPASALCFFETVKLLVDVLHLKESTKMCLVNLPLCTYGVLTLY